MYREISITLGKWNVYKLGNQVRYVENIYIYIYAIGRHVLLHMLGRDNLSILKANFAKTEGFPVLRGPRVRLILDLYLVS